MVKVNPYLGLDKSSDYDINFFNDPFLEDFRDPKTGLYLIGDGCATMYIRFSLDIPSCDVLEFPGATMVKDSSFIIEFDLYASPETLDFPEIREEPGVLHSSGITRTGNKWLRESARLYGASWWESLFVPWQVKREIPNALENEHNRRRIGGMVLEDFGRREDKSLQKILEKYEKKEGGNVIPLARII